MCFMDQVLNLSTWSVYSSICQKATTQISLCCTWQVWPGNARKSSVANKVVLLRAAISDWQDTNQDICCIVMYSADLNLV
jgi:hypothetical protein